MLTFFREGGIGMYPTLAFGLLLQAVAAAYALRPERKLLMLAGALGVADFLLGVLGTILGGVATFLYVSKLPPEQQFPTTLIGLAESLHNLALALGMIVLAALLVAGGTLRAALGIPAVRASR